jgi:hypothetical protein
MANQPNLNRNQEHMGKSEGNKQEKNVSSGTNQKSKQTEKSDIGTEEEGQLNRDNTSRP